MKFAFKMVASTVILVCVVLSVGVYLMVESSFHMEIENETEKAVSDTVMLCYGFESVASQPSSVQKSLEEIFSETKFLQSQSFRIYDVQNSLLLDNRAPQADLMERSIMAQGDILYRIFQEEGRYYIHTCSAVLYNSDTLYVERFQDITSVFNRKNQNFKMYKIMMAAVIFVVTILSAVISVFLTAPFRTLSRTTRKIAGGDYGSRIKMKSDDEIGAFIEDFNIMAGSLENKMEELEAAAQRQKDFTASFAHELKTPLTSIMGYADTLRSRELPADKRFQAANYIFTEGKRLESMSRALMELFITENREIEKQPVSAGKLFEQIRRSAEYSLQKKQLRFSVEAEDFVLWIEPDLIETMLLNLIDNARKATPPGGQVSLKGEKRGDKYLVCVQDTGRGIPAEEISKITDAFYMVDKSRSRAEGGAGIGLALCSKIADVHQTCLQFESTVGVGTQVCVELEGAKS